MLGIALLCYIFSPFDGVASRKAGAPDGIPILPQKTVQRP
jgi:hypothetical protein